MSEEENLDQYKSAYEEDFKFHDENLLYLSWYKDLLRRQIRGQRLKSVLSLGIGHKVVSEGIAAESDYGLERHHILDGSADIIQSYLESRENTISTVEEIYFENYSSEDRFDGIEMGFVLEHVDDPIAILRKFRDYLSPSGMLFVAVPNARSLHRLIGHHAGILEDMYKLSSADLQLGHKRYYDLGSIREALQSTGFDIQVEKGLMLKPITADQIEKLGFGEEIINALFVIGEDYPEIANCIYLEAKRVE